MKKKNTNKATLLGTLVGLLVNANSKPVTWQRLSVVRS